jgi:hypothetical protein
MDTDRAGADRYLRRMTSATRTFAVLALVLGACTAPGQPSVGASDPAQASAPPASEAAGSPPTASASPMPSAEPTTGPLLQSPEISLDPRPVLIEPSLTLRAPVIDAEVEKTVRSGVEDYLRRLDWYRRGQLGDEPPVSGRFGEVVKQGIASSRTPGVERTFVLESIQVQRYLVKPWGVPALAEAQVTILDRANAGSAPDQRETGRLRMLGDRLSVVDGWDSASQRWFNGDLERMTESKLRELVLPILRDYLRFETWIPGSPLETGFGPGTNPFWEARHKYIGGFDREKTVSRTFAGVTARIQLFETFSELTHGLATAHLTGTIVSVDASGKEGREPFERKVIVLIGNWGPEVVDQEIGPGVWVSAGSLMATLKERDRNFA